VLFFRQKYFVAVVKDSVVVVSRPSGVCALREQVSVPNKDLTPRKDWTPLKTEAYW
jgi:hypothetical protein